MVTIFSRDSGKISLFTFGARKITSRRISHLQTGNLVSFTASKNREYLNLEETELLSGFCEYAQHPFKADFMFLVFFILDKILPDSQNEIDIYSHTLAYLQALKDMDKENIIAAQFDSYAKSILCKSGFCSTQAAENPSFNPVLYVETILQRRVKRVFLPSD